MCENELTENEAKIGDQEHLDHLWRIHDNIQQTIRFADAKSFGLIALSSGILAVLASQAGALWIALFSMILAILGFVLLCVGMAYALSAIFPRQKQVVGRGHVFSKDITSGFADAEVFWKEIREADYATISKQVGHQVYVVASILNSKLRLVAVATPITLLGVIVSVLALVTAHTLPANLSTSSPDAPSAERQQITVAQYGDLLLYLPLYIAHEEGIFEGYGLEVSIVSTGGDEKTFAAVLAGDAQFGIADPTFAALAAQQGQPGKVIALLVDGVPNYAVSIDGSQKKIDDPRELDGLTIATVPAPSTSYAIIKQLYESVGLAPSIRQVAPAGLLAVVEAGDADAALLIEPWVSKAVRNGGSIVVSLPDYYDEFALTGVTTTPGWLNQNPEIAARFLAALRDAITLFYTDEEATMRAARASFPNEDPRDLLAGIRQHRLDQIHPFDLRVTESAWDAAIAIRRSIGDLQPTSGDFAEIVDNSLLEIRRKRK